MWEKTPFPLTFKVYLFNLTNPMEVVEGKKVKFKLFLILFSHYNALTLL